jgi:hypothetical protein
MGFGIKSPTTNTTTNTTAATGQSYADNNSQALSGFQLSEGATLNLTDLGAVGKAFDFTRELVGSALDQSAKASEKTAQAFESASSRTGAVDSDTFVKLVLFGVIALAGGVALLGSRK